MSAPTRLFAITTSRDGKIRRIATTGCVAAVLAVVMQAGVQASAAVGGGSDPRQVMSHEQSAHEGRSRSTPSEDPACVDLHREVAEHADSPELRSAIDEVCRTVAAAEHADARGPWLFQLPLGIVIVLVVVLARAARGSR